MLFMDPLIPALVSTVIQTILSAPTEPPPPPVVALPRAIPQETKVAEMQPGGLGQVRLDGRAYALSAGAQIRDRSNLIVMPMSLAGTAKVRYQLDAQGSVHRLWILTPAEAAQRAGR
jgi:hypothetical protein